VYLPTVLLAFGQGVMVPILPLYALEFGDSYQLAGLVVSAAWIGTLSADLPTGLLLPRLGFRRSMVLGCGLFGAGTIALAFAQVAPELVLYRFIAGIGTALWGLSRHTYITNAVAPSSRGRAIAVFGGINRIGWFAGPAVGGLLGQLYGLEVPILVAGLLALAALLVALVAVEAPAHWNPPRSHWLGLGVLREIVRDRRRELLAAGSAQIFAQMIRAARQLVIPLYGSEVIGLDRAQVGFIISLMSMVDMSLFLPAGLLMDRYGRKAAAVPSFVLLGLGMALIPLTDSYWTLLGAALVLGFGNGIGSGTMMTLGADLAPSGRTGEFLGIWRLIGDSGQATAPLVIGVVADLFGLAFTAGAIAGLGLAAAGTLALFVEETRWRQETRPATTRQSAANGH
jgi:MFS family permease